MEMIVQWWNEINQAQAAIITGLIGAIALIIGAWITRPHSTNNQQNTLQINPFRRYVIWLTVIITIAIMIGYSILARWQANLPVLAEQEVRRNSQWTPYSRDFNGVKMVLVPTGCLLMGSTTGDSDEQPVEEICLDAFWIDRTEVTQSNKFGKVTFRVQNAF